jgi:short-subunit dehydrogenase
MQDVSWIVTAAGRGLRGDVRDTSRDERLNFWKLMLLSRIDLLAWAQDRSHQQEHIGLINVSSSSGYFPLPKYGDYSASNNSLRLIGRVGNLGFPKLTLKTIVPGGMKTTLMKDYGDLKKFHAGAMDPEYVARKLVDMMKPHSRKEVPVGLNSRVLKILSTPIFNGAFQFVMNNISKRVR